MDINQQKKDLRDAVVETLTVLAAQGEKLIVLVSDSTSTSKIGSFATAFPDKLVNVGIAEQNLVGIAAGLSLQGFKPVTMNAACFLVNRSNEQVKNDICYSNTNVKLIGLNAGVTYGPLASTHHAIDDLSIMRGFGNIQIWAPCDAHEASQMITEALSIEGPVYIRLDNASFPILHNSNYRFKVGTPEVLISGSDLMIFAIGSVVHEAFDAAQELKSFGIDAGVVNISTLRPLDRVAVAELISLTPLVFTVEEHSVSGGLGSTIAEIIADEGIVNKLTRIGIPAGIFSVSGPRDKIRAHYGIDKKGIVEKVLQVQKSIALNHANS